jgi:hypothetical protein
MIIGVDHIGIIVSSLSDYCKALLEIGMTCNSVEKFDELGIMMAFIAGKETNLELVKVIDPKSPIAKYKKGIHHLGMKVNDLDGLYYEMEKNKKFLLEGNIHQGAHSRIFFFRIKGQSHTLFECVESKE